MRAKTGLVLGVGAAALAGAVAAVLVLVAPTGPATTPTGAGSPPASEQEPPPEAPVAQPELIVTFAGEDLSDGSTVVSAYLAGTIADGGTCTVTVTRDGEVFSVDSAATANVNDTQCGDLRFEPGALAPGTWSATVSYVRDDVRLESDPVEFDVRERE